MPELRRKKFKMTVEIEGIFPADTTESEVAGLITDFIRSANRALVLNNVEVQDVTPRVKMTDVIEIVKTNVENVDWKSGACGCGGPTFGEFMVNRKIGERCSICGWEVRES